MDGLRNSEYRHIEVSRIAGSLGAEVAGVDLAEELPDDVLAEIRRALLGNLVIFFRDQRLTPETQLAFARRWGEIHLHPYMAGMDDYPEVLEIVKTPADKKNFGGSWHSDQAFTPRPAMGTILYGKEIPSAGGDTLWTNLYLAYEALSPGMRRMLDELKGVYRGDNFSSHDGKTRKEFYCRQDRHEGGRSGQHADDLHPSAGADASRNRAARAVCRRPSAPVRGDDGSREPAVDRLPDAACGAAGIHLPLSLGQRVPRLLGQSLHHAFRHQRLSGGDADHAPRHRLRRRAVLKVGTRRAAGADSQK